jgi:hypothetical protein
LRSERKKPQKKNRRRQEIEDIEEEGEKEQGIDIDVSLPRKKVKDLEMLSGGERSSYLYSHFSLRCLK